MSKFGDMMSKLVYLKCITDRDLGTKSTAAGQFHVIFLKKIAILMPLDHILRVFRVI